MFTGVCTVGRILSSFAGPKVDRVFGVGGLRSLLLAPSQSQRDFSKASGRVDKRLFCVMGNALFALSLCVSGGRLAMSQSLHYKSYTLLRCAALCCTVLHCSASLWASCAIGPQKCSDVC